jgi:hypothetical protein
MIWRLAITSYRSSDTERPHRVHGNLYFEAIGVVVQGTIGVDPAELRVTAPRPRLTPEFSAVVRQTDMADITR